MSITWYGEVAFSGSIEIAYRFKSNRISLLIDKVQEGLISIKKGFGPVSAGTLLPDFEKTAPAYI